MRFSLSLVGYVVILCFVLAMAIMLGGRDCLSVALATGGAPPLPVAIPFCPLDKTKDTSYDGTDILYISVLSSHNRGNHMQTDIITQPTDKAQLSHAQAIGEAANEAAAANTFADYRSRKSANTLRRHDNDLAKFADFLREHGLDVDRLGIDPEQWQSITWGLASAFVVSQLSDGYAIATVNARLSSIKIYSKLALQAGTLSDREAIRIRVMKNYGVNEGKRVDEKRYQTRLEKSKAAEPVTISTSQAAQLKHYDDSPQGRRDALLFALLFDHGLRVGELAALDLDSFDIDANTFTFYRPKVGKTQTHEMTPDTAEAFERYLPHREALDLDGLLVGSMGRNRLTARRMSARGITKRVEFMGHGIGLGGLSAHDCRHHWATMAARAGTPLDRLMDAGGWNSPAMPARYIAAAAIANQGVKLA